MRKLHLPGLNWKCNKIHCLILVFSICISKVDAQFTLHPTEDISLLAGAGLLYLAPYIIKGPNHQLTIDVIANLDKNNLNFLDRSAAGKYKPELSDISDIAIGTMAIGTLTPLLLHSKMRDDIKTFGVLFVETMALSTALTRVSKTYISRIRPHVYSTTSTYQQKSEWAPYKSFFSGHACQSFAMATFLASTYPNGPGKKYVCIGVYSLATAIALLRYESGAHFPTDLLTGAAIGTAIGYLIPKMHRTSSNANIRINTISSTNFPLGVSVRFTLK